MENGDIVTDNSVLPQENRLQLNIVEDNRSDNLVETNKLEADNLLEEERDKDVEEREESENVSVPFFGGNLSLAQVKEMQIQARKRSKFSTRNIDFCSIKNDRTTNQLNKSEPINTASVLDFSENSSVYSVRSFGGERNKTYFESRTKENLDKTCHSAGELRIRSFDENKRFKRKTFDGFGKSRVENRGVENFERREYESRKIVDSIENKDRKLSGVKTSYLEQYRKRREKEVPGSLGAKSVSSSQLSLNLSCSTLKTDFDERVSEVGSSCLCCSSSDERLQKELLTDSDVKTHSSSFVSCESSVRSNEDGKEELMVNENVKEKEVEEKCGSKKNSVDGKSTKKQEKKTTKLDKEVRKPTKSPLIPMRLARSLGPDLEAIKPKLTALQKRKEYGNRMSCLNRENNQLKHISESNKIMVSSLL
ncbi:uncharacterized protein LOC111044409 [Nilaparvata lugens]|uniref:uncharacterized protein LOC111044409 n=1 Tax=Nilaparvata lugens TaxID=108931 RepID=UPI00193CD5D7|nr:uncharacterized protein LOC111044409 [Nilaparvata lugens]